MLVFIFILKRVRKFRFFNVLIKTRLNVYLVHSVNKVIDIWLLALGSSLKVVERWWLAVLFWYELVKKSWFGTAKARKHIMFKDFELLLDLEVSLIHLQHRNNIISCVKIIVIHSRCELNLRKNTRDLWKFYQLWPIKLMRYGQIILMKDAQ